MKSFSCGRIPLSQIYIKVSFNRLFRLLLAEIKKAPEHIQLKYDEIVSINSEIFTPYYETFELFEQYQKHEIISEKYTNDMLHIALATIANVDTSGTLFDLIKSGNLMLLISNTVIEHFLSTPQGRLLFMKTKKTFDCVQMTREIRNKIYEENKKPGGIDPVLCFIKKRNIGFKRGCWEVWE